LIDPFQLILIVLVVGRTLHRERESFWPPDV